MPRATIEHHYQHAVFGLMSAYAEKHCGRYDRGFIILLDAQHSPTRRLLETGPNYPDPPSREALLEGAPGWVYYDPFDAPEYGAASWSNVPRAVMEALMGAVIPPGPEPAYADSDWFVV